MARPSARRAARSLSSRTREQWLHVDPQRIYTGADIAFFGGYTTRTLTNYKYAPGGDGNTIVPDMATDTGTPNADATSWQFTLRDGVSFEDGTPVTCADIKYGVSRTFATDIITDGPQYAVSMLDIPKAEDGTSTYKGPYNTDPTNDTASFDKAITCSADGKTITFNLSRSVADFNYTVAYPAFSPVPKAADTGEKYDDKVVSTGPYKIQEYTKGQKMVLVRNENWQKSSDDYRPAYPDQVVVLFAQDPAAIDQRIIADAAEDQSDRCLRQPSAGEPGHRVQRGRSSLRGPHVQRLRPLRPLHGDQHPEDHEPEASSGDRGGDEQRRVHRSTWRRLRG